MKISEVLTESLSPIVYHYTNISAAQKILQSGKFELSSALGSIEEKGMPRGHYYFLSTARTKQGGYHDIVGSSAAMFVLDGDWFNKRYRSSPYDYWENRDPSKLHHRRHEAEDRVFSREPTIPADAIIELHVLIAPDAAADHKLWVRRTLLAAKLRNIPVFLYDDKKHWRNQDKRNTISVQTLAGRLDTRKDTPYYSRRPGYMIPWLELIYNDNLKALSKNADSIRYNIQYTYDKQQIVRGLNNDFSNARKPGSGPDRSIAVKIIAFMREHNLKNATELVDFLADKWKNIK